MKAVILAGGLGTRISEETISKPKPMVEIGGRPILWHIMKHYSLYGVNDFIICCGYKAHIIKEYFANYFLYMSDVTFDLAKNSMKVHQKNSETWKVTLVNTGESTQTGGRLKRVKKYIADQKEFCFTYGDGLSDINILSLIKFHRQHGKLATITGVFSQGRYGSLEVSENKVISFKEKPSGGDLINGGFFVLSPDVLDLITDDETHWELEPILNLVKKNELMVYQHKGFWQSMDTLRDKRTLEDLWEKNSPPWKVW